MVESYFLPENSASGSFQAWSGLYLLSILEEGGKVFHGNPKVI